jgi:hypothetical protein
MNEGIRDERRRLIMLWSPRAGCTVSCQMMLEQMGLLREALSYSNWIHHYRLERFYPRYGRPSNSQLRNELVFKTVVNPYQRAVSCYHHYCRNRLEERRANVSFYEYLKLLQRREIRDPRAVYHARPQYQIGERSVVNVYIKLEKGQQEIDRKLNRPYGFRLKIDNKTSQHHVKKREYRRFLGHTPFGKIAVLPKSYRCFYNPEIRRLVGEIFASDIKSYGYRFSDLP